ncbi:hypothetical protein niasHT_004004 [Heterodera trifolii]|uniref:Uncharacterized protein n=1 Tax=Heterodera trifolii TaxID=157864 RepID=A0ABD2L9A8_9BILA
MGVAREFGPWALNAREFRRAGLNPRVWLARRVNQSATDAVGGAVIFSVNVADPSPLVHRPGGADPLSHGPPLFTVAGPSPTARTPSLYCRGPFPPFRRPGGADPLSSTDPLSTAAAPFPNIPSSGRRGPPSLPRTPSPYCAAGPSPPFRCPSARTPSLHCRGPIPTIPSSGRRGPPLAIAADPGCASFAAQVSGCARGRGVGKTRLKIVPEAKFFCRSA